MASILSRPQCVKEIKPKGATAEKVWLSGGTFRCQGDRNMCDGDNYNGTILLRSQKTYGGLSFKVIRLLVLVTPACRLIVACAKFRYDSSALLWIFSAWDNLGRLFESSMKRLWVYINYPVKTQFRRYSPSFDVWQTYWDMGACDPSDPTEVAVLWVTRIYSALVLFEVWSAVASICIWCM